MIKDPVNVFERIDDDSEAVGSNLTLQERPLVGSQCRANTSARTLKLNINSSAIRGIPTYIRKTTGDGSSGVPSGLNVVLGFRLDDVDVELLTLAPGDDLGFDGLLELLVSSRWLTRSRLLVNQILLHCCFNSVPAHHIRVSAC